MFRRENPFWQYELLFELKRFYPTISNRLWNDIINDIIDSRIQIAEDSLFKNVLAGSVNAQKEFLHNRAPNRWKADAAINQIININKDKIPK